MNTVKQLLDAKGHDVWAIAPGDSVYDALKLMADKGVGAVLVLEGGKLVGIMSERDYARKVILKGKFSKDTPVRAKKIRGKLNVPRERFRLTEDGEYVWAGIQT